MPGMQIDSKSIRSDTRALRSLAMSTRSTQSTGGGETCPSYFLQAAERRAALAEAALHSSSTCLGNAHSHASSEAADALNLQRWSSFIGHDTAREAADAALRSTRLALISGSDLILSSSGPELLHSRPQQGEQHRALCLS